MRIWKKAKAIKRNNIAGLLQCINKIFVSSWNVQVLTKIKEKNTDITVLFLLLDEA